MQPTDTTIAQRMQIPFHRPSLGRAEEEAVLQVLRSGWLTMGPKTIEFEREFASFVGVKHALAVSSCTAGLHLALEALGIRENDEVLVPTLTFTATAEVVTYLNAKPVLVDCEPTYYNIDFDAAHKKCTPKTRAIVPVHFAGMPCDMRRLKEFAEEHRIYVLEDAAHAFPAKYENAYVGTQSSATAYSFYATKTLTTGEGGMVVTNSDELLARMQTMRLHGMSKDAWKRYTAGGSWFYEIVAPGFKYNLTDLQSAIGLVQLAKAERMRVQRQNIAECYSCALKCVAELILPTPNPLAVSAWHLYVVLVNLDMLRISRDEVMLQLQARGISCAVHFIPLHYHPYYQQSWGYALGDFPAAEAYFKRCISLPLYPEMTQQEVDYVVTNLIDIVKANRR